MEKSGEFEQSGLMQFKNLVKSGCGRFSFFVIIVALLWRFIVRNKILRKNKYSIIY